MPRSSRHKSHKQSKHSSKEAKEYSDTAEEDVKMRERNAELEGSVRASKDLASGEKRKFVLESKDSKDLAVGHANGEVSEDYTSSKRRKEKAEGNGGDRWNNSSNERSDVVSADKATKGEGPRFDSDKGSKTKLLVDSKSKISKRHDTGSDKKDENITSAVEKEDGKSNSRLDSKRKSERDSGRKESHTSKDLKDLKDKERGSDRQRKAHDAKHDTQAQAVDSEVAKKHGSQSVDYGDDRQIKRGRENTEWSIKDELRNPELEKELEKRMRRRRDSSADKYDDEARETDDKHLSSRGERSRDGRCKDASRGDKYREDGEKDKYHEDGERNDRHKDSKYRDDSERDSRRRDDKYRDDSERESRRRDDKYRDGNDRDHRQRDDKYFEDLDRDNRHKDDKYREDGDRDSKQKDDKYREDGDRHNRHRDSRYHEDGGRDNKFSDEKYHEDRSRSDRRREDKYREDGTRVNSLKEEKHGEDVDRDSRHRDGRQRDDIDRERRLRDVRYRDEGASRDRASDKYDPKRLKDDVDAADLHHRNSNNCDGSPSYDDRIGRYKDDHERRKSSEKEEQNDNKSRSSKLQLGDAERRSVSTAKVDVTAERGRSNSRNTDSEFTLNHSRQRRSTSSSSYVARDHERLSKQEEVKYKEYSHDDRIRHSASTGREFPAGGGENERISLSRLAEKAILKDDSYFGDYSADWRPKSEARSSPLKLADKSSSSMSTDRRHLNRSDVSRSLDVEEMRQRSGGSKDAKDYSGNEGRRGRDLPVESLPVDEISQADGDNLSVSSPFPRSNHLSGNTKSLLPPPAPFRTGADSPSIFGALEDDNRGKSSNRHRRLGDPNMGRGQGSAWKGIPNWHSPMSNGFMPFQHGLPPVGFHPVMQQFPAPPIFGVRPSVELNHGGVPYHIPEADRFSGHLRPIGWHNPVDDSCPLLHGWDSNNASFADESQIYGRISDWDNGRSHSNSRGWETSVDMWKGQNSGVSAELPSASLKEDISARGAPDDVWSGQSGQQAESEQNQPELQAESVNICQSSDPQENEAMEATKLSPDESLDACKTSGKNDSHLCLVYLSKLDISVDLTQPDLYDQYSSLMDVDEHATFNENNSKILYMEKGFQADTRTPDRTSSGSLFAAIDDSIFQKALSLYKKQKEEFGFVKGNNSLLCNVHNPENVLESDQETSGKCDISPGEPAPACDQKDGQRADFVSNSAQVELPVTFQDVEMSAPIAAEHKLDESAMAKNFEMSEDAVSPARKIETEVDPIINLETVEQVGGEILAQENEDRSDVHSAEVVVEDVKDESGDSGGNLFPNNNNNNEQEQEQEQREREQEQEQQKLLDANKNCGPLLFSDVSSSEAVVMPESVESGIVNLSRIHHHSPESTH